MTATLITGIAELVTNDSSWSAAGQAPDVARLGIVTDAAVLVEAGEVVWVGPASAAPQADSRVDVGGCAVMPGFVDSHTHLVFAGDRAAEFAARMAGTAYDGGGIATTVAATRGATDDELRTLLAARIAELRRQGTTTVEIKSGYGLSVEDELRLLRLAREVTPHVTFLGAHVVPAEYAADRAAYLDLVTGPMLAAVVAQGAASYVDVFCEPLSAHAFTEDEAR